MKIVAGDIGGTHARFALAEFGAEGGVPVLRPMHKYRTREHDGLAGAWAAFARDVGAPLPRAAAFGVASAIDGDVLHFPNSGWTIDRLSLASELGLDRALILNDFGAVAHAVSVLPEDGFRSLHGPDGPLPRDGTVTVMGPGTGLGVAMLVRRDGAAAVIETEAAHIAFAPQTEAEARIEALLRARHGRCSVERIVSGPGLLTIHEALGGPRSAPDDAGALWAAAIDGGDPLAAQALDILVGALAAAAGDLSLAHGAMAVVLTGGLANRMPVRLSGADFRTRFVAKGRYAPRMERVQVKLSTHDEPGLLGAAVAFRRASAGAGATSR